MVAFSLVMRKSKDKKPAYFQIAISPRLSRYDTFGGSTLSPKTHSRMVSEVHNFLRFGTPADTIVHVPLSVARLNSRAQQDLTRSFFSFENLMHTQQPLRPVPVLEGKEEYINAINSLAVPLKTFDSVSRNRPAFCITSELSEADHLRTEILKRIHMEAGISTHMGLSTEAQSSKETFLQSVQAIQGKTGATMDRAKRCSVFKSFGRSRGQDYFDSVGQTVLHWAAKRNDVPMARLLKQAGAEIDAVDMALRTPLFMAARSDMPEMVDFLLEAGANRSFASLNGKTPCTAAKEGGLAWALLNRRTLNPPPGNLRKRSSFSKGSDKP